MITKIHLLHGIKPAGVENMCLNLTKIDSHNRNIAVYTNKDSNREMIKIYQNFFDKVKLISHKNTKAELISLINNEKLINNEVVLISWFFPFNIKFISKLNVPMLSHIGTTAYAYGIIRKIKNQLIFLNLYFAKKNKVAFIYASEHIKKSYQEYYFYPKNIFEKVIHNGDLKITNDKNKISYNSLNTLKFAMVGRLDKTKDFREYIHFSYKFNLKNSGHEYLIIGDGDDFDSLNILNSKLNSICTFLGTFHEIEKIYEKFDILLFFNTNAEGFGNVIIESMNRCKLVVVRDCGGPAELIEDGVTGLKFRNIEELNHKLFNLLNDPLKIKKIILNAKQKFDKTFDISLIKNKYDLILEKLIS